MMNTRDIFADTWVGTDDAGRSTGTDNGAVNCKKTGIFYFLWHDPVIHGGNGKLYDHSKAYAEGGAEGLKKIMTEGPMGFAHYWAEPYLGYYRSDDEWVIRKHTNQLVDAGIDFIFIDATNGLTYRNTYETIFRVWTQMRAEGNRTPQICFHCGDNMQVAPRSYQALWNDLYSCGRYEEFWFRHNGKPLIFLPKQFADALPTEQRDFFTVRHSWANTRDHWYRSLEGKACWPWADMYPQGMGLSEDGKPEQMIVMSGFWVNGSFGTNAGRSYSYKNGGQPKNLTDSDFGFSLAEQGTSGQGIAFAEQFDRAIEQCPDLIMLVGWNEWWAGRWEAGPAVSQTIANTYTVTDDSAWTRHYYVDAFNPEFSRDIEPVKGFYNDNYYYQMTQNIRRFKGSRAPLPASGQKAIDLNGPAAQWDSVGPEYRDAAGDTAHRDCTSYVGGFRYINESGRNDFITAKVSRHGEDIFFFAECAETITPAEGTNWMNLFIDADCDPTTGWYGYDYVINRTRDGGTCSVHRFVNNSWEMEEIGTADYTVSGNCIQIRVDAALLNPGDDFDFKWADNSVDDGNIMQFIDCGDTAPDGRFNYRYTVKSPELPLPVSMIADRIVLKSGSYHAFAGGRMVQLDPSSTRAVVFGEGDHLYVPASFAEGVTALSVGELPVCTRDGIVYTDIGEALKNSGKTVSTGNGIIVIADTAVSEAELLILSRALY